ncbi:PRC-barrel domain-containing protein [Gulosibacter sediminis]|uniref:PRC-barrel domain-containing protein n=1 Tax=Gulosibacter sediminis TaxID=1729695 RepID=UPI0024A8A19F|nr:PRC-barrel domain-containing protein [Gulosibacter sediminis]
MADSNDFQDDAVDPTSDDAASVPADAVSPSDDSGDASIEALEVGDDEISVAPNEVENAAPTEEELAAREAEAALLLIFQSTVFDKNGAKIGRVGQVYLDDQTQEPNWVTVKTGMFGTKEYFIPLDESEQTEKRITVPYDKAKVHSAPFTEIDQNLSPEEEDELYNYYEVPGRTTAEGSLNVADPDDDAPKQKAEPETIAPLGGGVSREDEPLRASDLLGDTTDSGADAPATSSAFDDIVADAPSESDAQDATPASDTGDASPFDALAADAEAETPQRGDSDALSFDAFTDDGDDAENGDASPFERPDREN